MSTCSIALEWCRLEQQRQCMPERLIARKAGSHLGLDLGRSRLAKEVALEISKVITQLPADLGKLIKHELCAVSAFIPTKGLTMHVMFFWGKNKIAG